jgi:hypothetical protein
MTLFAMILLALSSAAPATAAEVAPATAPAPLPTQPAGIGIRLVDMPASTKDDPRASTYIIDRLAPGAEIKRRVRVENNTGSVQTVRVYQGAAHIDGGAFIGDDAATKNELSVWTQVAQPQVDLPAGGSAEVLVTIKVPADAAESEQYGAIWAEVRSRAANGVVQANRVGIRIYLSVGAGNGKPADFTITSVTAGRGKDGNPELSAVVTNTGGRALDITGGLSLTGGPGGLSAGPFNVQKAATIAPGNAQPITFAPPSVLPNGPWTAQIKLRSGLLERAASATVTFPEAGPGEPVAPVRDDGTHWLSVATIAAAVLLALLAAVWLVLRRHRPGRAAAASPGTQAGKRQRANIVE